MNLFVRLIQVLQTTAPEPVAYGWFHGMWWLIMIAVCVVIYLFRQRINQSTVTKILLITGVVLLVLEIFKQLIYTFEINEAGQLVAHYQTHAFPFQFCSTPMYVMILAGIFRQGRVHESLLAYLATYALIAGLTVMMIPDDVFGTSYVYVQNQTMFWHASMVVIAFLLLVTRSVPCNFQSLWQALIVFVIMVGLAVAMNFIAHWVAPDESFNMFYLGPYHMKNFAIIGDLHTKIPWLVFLALYILVFTLGSALVLAVSALTNWWTQKIRQRNKA